MAKNEPEHMWRLTYTELRAAVDELLDADEDAGLTPWEIEFVDSIDKQLDGGKALSQKQLARLEEIQGKL